MWSLAIVVGQQLGHAVLRGVATLVMAGAILRWHRELIARNGVTRAAAPAAPGVVAEIRRLVVRIAA